MNSTGDALKEHCNNMLSLCPTDGNVLYTIGKMQDNIQMVQEAHRLDPTNKDVLLYLGDYYEKQSLYEKAKRYYSELVLLYGSGLHYYKMAVITKLTGNFIESYTLAKKSYEIEKSLNACELLLEISKDLNLPEQEKWEQLIQHKDENNAQLPILGE